MGRQDAFPWSRRGIIDSSYLPRQTDALMKRFDIRAPGPGSLVKSLSGGNIQKVVLAREFSTEARFLLIDQPTRGVDIGATEAIHGEIMRQRGEGRAILLISVQLDELIALADRILVMFAGLIMGDLDAAGVTEEELGLLMAGVVPERPARCRGGRLIATASRRALRPGAGHPVRLVLGAIIIVAINESPVRVLVTLLAGAFGSQERIAGTLLQTTPILVCGVAACISLRGGLFNIGIEGQLFMGGFAAAWLGFSFSLPPVIHLLAAMAFAVFAGVAWIAIPAFFRARYNTNEVVSTILANYVAILITSYLTINFFKRPGGLAETPPILPTAYLPEFFSFSRLNWGLVIGLALAIGTQLFFHRTARGYAISEMGANAKFAEYGGIDIDGRGFSFFSPPAPLADLPAASRRSASIAASWKVSRPVSALTASSRRFWPTAVRSAPSQRRCSSARSAAARSFSRSTPPRRAKSSPSSRR